jgi:hypothetical protein
MLRIKPGAHHVNPLKFFPHPGAQPVARVQLAGGIVRKAGQNLNFVARFLQRLRQFVHQAQRFRRIPLGENQNAHRPGAAMSGASATPRG